MCCLMGIGTFYFHVSLSVLSQQYIAAGYLSFRSETDGEILENFTGHFADPFDIMLIMHIILYVFLNSFIVQWMDYLKY